jgi:hypothetical protein
MIGKTLDKYQIVAEIGSGGMATVYRAYQPNLERYVAVKVLSAQLASDPIFRQRFDREAKEAARLSHPNILPVYDSGEYEGTVYIVTEFVEGGSLKDRMSHPLEPGVAARIAHDIAHALDYAHRHGLVHRDVKPGNVLMTRDGRTLLADFGIAKAVSGTQYTQTGMAVGTPAYMSPEQARGEEVDGRSDLYALGIVLYEMLLGHPPFQADTPLAVLHQQVSVAPVPPRALDPSVPRRLEKVVLTSLAKPPADRYRSGREMAAALESAVRLAPVEQLPGLEVSALATEPVRPAARRTVPRAARATGQTASRVGKGAGRALGRVARFALGVALVVFIALLVIGLVTAIGGAFALASFAERTIPSYAGQLSAFEAFGQEMATTEQQLDLSVGSAVKPYTLDSVQDVGFDLSAPDKIVVDARIFGRPVHLQGRLALESGMLRIYLERLNGVPLYIVGGILSGGVNRGIQDLFQQAHFQLAQLDVRSGQIVLLASREGGAPHPTATPTRLPSPTIGPTTIPTGTLEIRNRIGEGLLLEISGQQWKLGADQMVELTLPAGEYSYSFRVEAPDYAPGKGSVTVIAGHSVLTIQAGPTTTPLPLTTPAATAPARTPKPGAGRHTPTPSASPTRSPRCPNPGARITSPGVDAVLRGQVTVRGSAGIPGFSYYKLELGAGSSPKEWAVLGPLQYAPVTDGVLGTWDTGYRPAGAYVLRLAVVDNTGNFKACDVSVQITR